MGDALIPLIIIGAILGLVAFMVVRAIIVTIRAGVEEFRDMGGSSMASSDVPQPDVQLEQDEIEQVRRARERYLRERD